MVWAESSVASSENMQPLGIIGGIAPESTVEYYRLLVAGYRERTPDGSYPQLIVNSIDMQYMLEMVGGGKMGPLVEYLTGEVQRLARSGAELGLFASNTPHIVFAEVERVSPIPLVSIVEAACGEAKSSDLQKVGLFGTRFTMQGDFYRRVFVREGLTLVTPNPEEQDYIHGKYMGELVKAVFLPETRSRLLQIAERMRERDGIQGLILGGTELPLILRDVTVPGLPLLDTTRIHVRAALDQWLKIEGHSGDAEP